MEENLPWCIFNSRHLLTVKSTLIEIVIPSFPVTLKSCDSAGSGVGVARRPLSILYDWHFTEKVSSCLVKVKRKYRVCEWVMSRLSRQRWLMGHLQVSGWLLEKTHWSWGGAEERGAASRHSQVVKSETTPVFASATTTIIRHHRLMHSMDSQVDWWTTQWVFRGQRGDKMFVHPSSEGHKLTTTEITSSVQLHLMTSCPPKLFHHLQAFAAVLTLLLLLLRLLLLIFFLLLHPCHSLYPRLTSTSTSPHPSVVLSFPALLHLLPFLLLLFLLNHHKLEFF